MKCERCGKFRKPADLATSEHGDGPDAGLVTECRWCMSPADRKRFNMPTEGDPMSTENEYTPTTAEIREHVAWEASPGSMVEARAFAAFDRWLAAHDADVAAKALEDAADAIRHKQHPESVRQMLRARAAALRASTGGENRG